MPCGGTVPRLSRFFNLYLRVDRVGQSKVSIETIRLEARSGCVPPCAPDGPVVGAARPRQRLRLGAAPGGDAAVIARKQHLGDRPAAPVGRARLLWVLEKAVPIAPLLRHLCRLGSNRPTPTELDRRTRCRPCGMCHRGGEDIEDASPAGPGDEAVFDAPRRSPEVADADG